MKKILSLLTVVAISSALTAVAAESRLENYVNKKLSPITQKEKELNSKKKPPFWWFFYCFCCG